MPPTQAFDAQDSTAQCLCERGSFLMAIHQSVQPRIQHSREAQQVRLLVREAGLAAALCAIFYSSHQVLCAPSNVVQPCSSLKCVFVALHVGGCMDLVPILLLKVQNKAAPIRLILWKLIEQHVHPLEHPQLLQVASGFLQRCMDLLQRASCIHPLQLSVYQVWPRPKRLPLDFIHLLHLAHFAWGSLDLLKQGLVVHIGIQSHV
mmetsp:Transcript_27257/g.73652  ORF Transcript_27257/g.73652 Transcript_27257/m.73652 type:complete len:205 (+) Transcript_27257:1145-1759(+)